MNARMQKLKDTKPADMLAHLYVDGAGDIRDRHIEDMWLHLYAGRELDDIFRTNFCMYHGHLTGRGTIIDAAVFDNVIVAERWVRKHYGTLTVLPFDPKQYATDPDLAPMRFLASLRGAYSPASGEHCYSPHKLHAVLLTVVHTFRHLAHEHAQRLSD